MTVTPVTGKWNLAKTFEKAITSDFTINISGISEATQYEVWANGSAISAVWVKGKSGAISVTKSFRTLSVAFEDISKLTVKLLNASGDQVGLAELSGTTTDSTGSGAMNY